MDQRSVSESSREREAVSLDLVGVAGLTAFVLGLAWLQSSPKIGFDPGQAFDGVLSQLSVTLPAATLVLAASALELIAGMFLARAARRAPFDSVAEALLAAMVAAVLKDTLLLGTLGALGLFRAPVLIGIDVAIVAATLVVSRGLGRDATVLAVGGVRAGIASIRSWPVAALVLVVWTGPVVLQLASPVVPFIDVLPNYVGPVEHLRTFGWFSPLTETQSPIIGPSRTVLGYDALLGSLATMTNLSGGLAIAGFILPQTVLVAAGAHCLASAIRRGDPPVGAWALLAFALSQPFARLADARGTVVVVPLVCLALALTAELVRTRGEPDGVEAAAANPWRIGRGAVIGFALAAATLVHPVIGFFAIVTVAIVALVRPREAGPDALVAGVTAGLVALPQLATMVGASLPTLVLGIAVPVGIAVGIAVSGLLRGSESTRRAVVRAAQLARVLVPIAAVALVALALAIGKLELDRLPDALGQAVAVTVESSGLLLVVLVGGALLGSRGARSPIVLAGIGLGFVAVVLVQALPGDLGFFGDALRFEVPKTVHYWTSTVAAAGAACALASVWSGAAGAQGSASVWWPARAAAVAAFVVVAALPLRLGNSGDDGNCTKDCASINAYHLGEHRYAETMAIDLHFAGPGFWSGFPDRRNVVDTPRREILDALRREIDAGRLAHDTQVLHLAQSFQQWVATPLGVFDGVDETFVSLDPEVSHQTVGGRLFGFDSLAGFLISKAFGYVVLEPDGLPDGLESRLAAAGYDSIYANEQGEVFRLHTSTP